MQINQRRTVADSSIDTVLSGFFMISFCYGFFATKLLAMHLNSVLEVWKYG